MHFRGFVFLPELSMAALEAAMAPHEGKHWDWYRPGGRYDGYFGDPEVARARATSNGFNFDAINENIELNAIKAAELTRTHACYFAIIDGKWLARETYHDNIPNADFPSVGSMVANPDFADIVQATAKQHPDHYVVVVDVHN